jgi:hypothetical protein
MRVSQPKDVISNLNGGHIRPKLFDDPSDIGSRNEWKLVLYEQPGITAIGIVW